MLWLMFFRLNVSVDAAKTATSSTRGRERPLEACDVGDERRIARARTTRDAGEHLRGVGHLRHPLRADEGGDFDHGKPGRAQAIDELDLVGGRHRGALVLQPVARPDLDDRDVFGHVVHAGGPEGPPLQTVARRAPSFRARLRRSINTASACTSSPSRQCTAVTTASAGARTGSSIFIASSTTSVSPFFTAEPAGRESCSRGPASARSAMSRRPASALASRPDFASGVRSTCHGNRHERRVHSRRSIDRPPGPPRRRFRCGPHARRGTCRRRFA